MKKAIQPRKVLTKTQKKVERIKTKNKAKGDPNVPKQYRIAVKIIIEEQDNLELLKYFDGRMNVGQAVD